jgi:hypothetical protein
MLFPPAAKFYIFRLKTQIANHTGLVYNYSGVSGRIGADKTRHTVECPAIAPHRLL